MITKYNENLAEHLSDSVDYIEIKVDNKIITVEGKFIGAFEIYGIKERIVNSMGELMKLRVPDFCLIEIHESQIGEIEALHNNRIDTIGVVYNTGRDEKYVIPLVYHHFRITSTGDLRIELGQRPCMNLGEYNPKFLTDSQLFSMTEHMLRFEFTPGYMFGKNKVWDYDNSRYKIIEENERKKEANLKKENHVHLLNERTEQLKDVIRAVQLKTKGSKRIMALASLVDIKYQESIDPGKLQNDLGINQYSIIETSTSDIENFRMERVYKEITGVDEETLYERLSNTFGSCLLKIIENVCNEFGKAAMDKLLEEVKLKDSILDFNNYFKES